MYQNEVYRNVIINWPIYVDESSVFGTFKS